MKARFFYDTIITETGSISEAAHHKSLTEKMVLECDCGTHLIMLQSEVDIYANNQYHQDFYFSIFNYGQWKRKIWDRIKLAWKILKTGEPYADQIVLNPDEAKKLVDFISNHIKTPNP